MNPCLGKVLPALLRRSISSAGKNSAVVTSSVTSRHQSTASQQTKTKLRSIGRSAKGYSRSDCQERLQEVEAYSNTELKNLGTFWEPNDALEPSILKGNIELPIGLSKVPTAAVGPLFFHGMSVQDGVIAPLATTEGALIASLSRGVATLNAAGGVETYSGLQRMNRDPVIVTGNPHQAIVLGEWAKRQVDRIQEEVVTSHTKHGKLVEIMPFYDKEILHLVFRYETGDASGQNMSTTCTKYGIDWILDKLDTEFPPGSVEVKFHTLEASLSGDKRASVIHSLVGRGISASAETYISEEMLNKYLKVSSDEMVLLLDYVCNRAALRAAQIGGFNANIVNVLAAMFTATGQDIACLIESSIGQLGIRKHPSGGITASIYLPSLVIGTVGGGTNLPTQAECLKMMGCHGAGKVRRLAEVMAGFCLALDLSTCAAMATNQFADAHDRLGKNRPTDKA